MARYLVHVRTPMPPTEAFAYMADLNHFAEWDPGVQRVRQVRGDGPGADASFDVAVSVPGRSITLRYDIVAFDSPNTVTAFAENSVMSSKDTITVTPAEGNGSIVTYDAVLKLKGPLGLFDPLLRKSFDKIGDRAAAGLIAALSGERVAEPAAAS